MVRGASSAAARSRIADPALADAGDRLIDWVARHSPVLRGLARSRLADGALRGRRIAVVVHLEAKTAYLALLLAEAGAQVVAAGSNPRSTQDAVCAALARRGVEVHATHGATQDEFDADLLAVADTGPELVVDDGAELTQRILTHRPEIAARLRGVAEETTTGIACLRELEARGGLTFPAIAVNDAWCKHLFDNRFGSGQSVLAAILRLTNTSAPGKVCAVIGYGWVGRGLAHYADRLGMRVTVVEVDPVRALEAHAQGHRVAPVATALEGADIVITATGHIDAFPPEAIIHLRDRVFLANAGHHDAEIPLAALADAAVTIEDPRPGVTTYVLRDRRRIHLLAGGALVNIAGGDGHPVEIMDLSFAVQALAVHHLATNPELGPGLHPFPSELDREIARTKLASLGIALDPPPPVRSPSGERPAER